MNKLDIMDFPLSAHSLIEASAGTGKTFTITHLYIRLLVGHQCTALSVEQILLVTFTKAATAELKQRIRERINQTWRDFYAGTSGDPLTQILINEIQDKQLAAQLLALASKQMDEAAIFTIHSFCQRMLLEHAFESGMQYEQSLILDESEFLQQASEDFWRNRIAPLSADILSIVLKNWSSPEDFLRAIGPLMYRKAHQLNPVNDVQESLTLYRQLVDQTKVWWIKNEVSERLSSADLNGRSVISKGSCHQAMEHFCQGDELEFSYNRQSWLLFSPAAIEKARKKSSKDLSDLDFCRFEQLQTLQQTCHSDTLSYFTYHGLQEIKARLFRQKQQQNTLSADDLLNQLKQALDGDEERRLAQRIWQQFPTALIDEFQDTDPAQFDIFRQIYQDKDNACLVMIGDPKQAIYGFRGADIYTYIQAKQQVEPGQRFTLATNWRSQRKLVESINYLFANSPQGFMFEQEIPFEGVDAAKQHQQLLCKGTPASSISFQWLGSENQLPLSWSAAQHEMAAHTASQICDWLQKSRQDQAHIGEKPLKAGDCCVLVRDRNEADLIKQSLARLNIASVFLVRKSVFATDMAYQLGVLLNALHHPSDERLIRAALLCELFCFSAREFDQLLENEVQWQQLMEEFVYWRQLWQRKGVMTALSAVISYFSVYANQVKYFEDGIRRVTDIRHLLELLQQQSTVQQGEAQLVRWYQERLAEPDHNMEGQQLRLETDEDLVQIITVHGSKGLEYPLVFLPFASRYKEQKQALFHDENHRLVVDLQADQAQMQQADRERLAEDIRLFYVAVTRAVFYCSIGLWNNGGNNRSKQSEFVRTAIGSLLFDSDTPITEEDIHSHLQYLSSEADIEIQTVGGKHTVAPMPMETQSEETLSASELTDIPNNNWRVTSYSAISHHGKQSIIAERPGQDEGSVVISEGEVSDVFDAYQFEKGSNAGSFLHGVLENIDFQQRDNLPEVVAQQGQWFGIDESWWPCVASWLEQVVQWPLNKENMTLSDLTPDQYKVEMEFYLPLKEVQVADFNTIISAHFSVSFQPYHFGVLNGMLKGFIDLTFESGGQFFIADYKSNHLGYRPEDYSEVQMTDAMMQHDYLLQAILYTVALHRWLKLNLPDYDYQRHIGGAYYLFLRGMQGPENTGQGVYYYHPPEALIDALDSLFDNQFHTDRPQKDQGAQLSLW